MYLNPEKLLICSSTNHCNVTATGSSCFIFWVWQVFPLCVLQWCIFCLCNTLQYRQKKYQLQGLSACPVLSSIFIFIFFYFLYLSDIIGLFSHECWSFLPVCQCYSKKKFNVHQTIKTKIIMISKWCYFSKSKTWALSAVAGSPTKEFGLFPLAREHFWNYKIHWAYFSFPSTGRS